jgi:hypothetical protein
MADARELSAAQRCCASDITTSSYYSHLQSLQSTTVTYHINLGCWKSQTSDNCVHEDLSTYPAGTWSSEQEAGAGASCYISWLPEFQCQSHVVSESCTCLRFRTADEIKIRQPV